MKKVILLITISISIGLVIISFMLLSNINGLKSQLSQSKSTLKNSQEETERLQTEKERVAKDNDKLKANALSFVELNTKLQEETDKAQKSQQELEKVIKAREALLKTVKSRFRELEKKVEGDKTKLSLQDKLNEEMDSLKQKIISLDGTLKEERALYHYNLGVAYSQAKFYDEAIEEYEKSLKFSFSNADAHYNLGLLYENIKNDPEKALEHYHKYLEIKPQAVDKEEVESGIKKLEAIIRAQSQKR